MSLKINCERYPEFSGIINIHKKFKWRANYLLFENNFYYH